LAIVVSVFLLLAIVVSVFLLLAIVVQWPKEERQMDKQWSIKHYTENYMYIVSFW
jgi:hypothetical protein